MDEGTREVPAVSGEAAAGPQDPEELRREIEHTREELGDTVEALAYKADVKAQAKERVEEAKAGAAQKRDEVVSKVKRATPGSAQAGAESATRAVRGNPVPAALAGAFAAGLLAGRMLARR